jgi:hypothetical protein
MDDKKALEILCRLADGIDPHTGEIFSGASPYQHPDTIRALYRAIEAMKNDVRRAEHRKRRPERAGKPWDSAESMALVERFKQGFNVSQLAIEHQRTRGAIESQLIRIGAFIRPESQGE